MYTPSRFTDKAPGFPYKLITNPFTQQQYDYNKRLHFGFVVSLSALDYKVINAKRPQYNSDDKAFNYFADITELSPAMGVAALMDYRINHSFSLRVQAGPTFGTRFISFYDADKDNMLHKSMQMESVLVEAAFLLKYKAMRHSDVRPYMIAGLTPYCDVAAFKSFNEKREIFIALNPFDLALAGGVGVDMYADYFKFSLELKYVMGTINALSNKVLDRFEEYPNAIEAMYSHSFVLSIIFE
ncbi:MAG: PorT family protein [Prevotellaceae bacterium]|nr:PorT family protein [Prevotellaceae bacterium]